MHEQFLYIYVVTNRHVINHPDMENPIIRINTKDGSYQTIQTDKNNWIVHPYGNDIAICPLGLNNELDFSFLNSEFLLTKDFVKKNVGAGDDIFMIGNFQMRGGVARNYPTVRFGNITQMPNEPIVNPHTNLQEESFLVEMHSTSGYSGSPVFLSINAINNRFHKIKQEKKGFLFGDPNDYYRLLGIDWGHLRINEKLMDRDGNFLPNGDSIWINSAMAGVIPSWFLEEMLFDEEEIEKRRKIDEDISNKENAK